MDFDLTEEQELLATMMNKFMSDRYDPVKRLSYVEKQDGFCKDGWKILADMGMLAFPFAEQYGGFGSTDGAGIVEQVTVMEIFGKSVATDPVLPTILMAGLCIEHAGTEAQKDEWLDGIISGVKFAALAHCEQKSRYNLDAVEANAKTIGDNTTLSGSKTLVLGGSFADVYIVSAVDQTASSPSSEIGLYLVDAKQDGIEKKDYRMTDGSLASDLHFHSVDAVPMAGGNDALKLVLDRVRIAICAELVGLMDHMFEATLEYVKTRQQFGGPLGRNQVIQHRMADNYTRLELSRSHLYKVAAMDHNDQNWHVSIAGAKSFISENAVLLGEDSIQLHGGIGTTEELYVGQAFKRTLFIASLFGDEHYDLKRYLDLSKPQ